MNREQILKKLSERKDISKIVKNITNNDKYFSEELYQELFIVLCELPEEKLVMMEQTGWIDYYIIKTLSNMFNSSSSRFYYKIKRPVIFKVDHYLEDGTDSLDLLESDLKCKPGENSHDFMDSLGDNIDSLHWFDCRILKVHLELKTIKAVAEFTGINSRYISESLTRSRIGLKEKISKEVKDKRENDIW